MAYVPLRFLRRFGLFHYSFRRFVAQLAVQFHRKLAADGTTGQVCFHMGVALAGEPAFEFRNASALGSNLERSCNDIRLHAAPMLAVRFG